jgi:N-acetylmuramoyl-L-alanine amidase
MTQYHTFYEIAPTTPGAIIEIGFLNLDRALLTEEPERVATGVATGILCYLRDEPIEGEVVGEDGQ